VSDGDLALFVDRSSVMLSSFDTFPSVRTIEGTGFIKIFRLIHYFLKSDFDNTPKAFLMNVAGTFKD
jgi:hypothetical protein